jgi:transketolase
MADVQIQKDAAGSATPRIIGMRDAFFNALFEIFRQDKNCVMITADNGAPSLDQFARQLSGQFVQVGIAEQQMFGMAAGLAVEGKKVFCYAIAPFVTTRVHEFIKLDVCAMNLPIVLLGVGAGFAYDIMGPSHHTVEDISIMRCLPNLTIWSPADSVTAAALAEESYRQRGPQYIRFDRAGIPDIYRGDIPPQLGIGYDLVEWPDSAKDVVIISTGVMVHESIKASRALAADGIKCGVIDLFRLTPVDAGLLLDDLMEADRVVTLEEHFLAGGLGSVIAEIFVDNGITKPLKRIGMPPEFTFTYGGREEIWKRHKLDAASVAETIRKWVN